MKSPGAQSASVTNDTSSAVTQEEDERRVPPPPPPARLSSALKGGRRSPPFTEASSGESGSSPRSPHQPQLIRFQTPTWSSNHDDHSASRLYAEDPSPQRTVSLHSSCRQRGLFTTAKSNTASSLPQSLRVQLSKWWGDPSQFDRALPLSTHSRFSFSSNHHHESPAYCKSSFSLNPSATHTSFPIHPSCGNTLHSCFTERCSHVAPQTPSPLQQAGRSKCFCSRQLPNDGMTTRRTFLDANTQPVFDAALKTRILRSCPPVYRCPEVERLYGLYLKAIMKPRALAVGLVLAVLNMLYDLPVYVATTETEQDIYSDARTAFATNVVKDVVEVLLNITMAASGYLPLLRNHMEATILLTSGLAFVVNYTLRIIITCTTTARQSICNASDYWLMPVPSLLVRSMTSPIFISFVLVVRFRFALYFTLLIVVLLLVMLLVFSLTTSGLKISVGYFVPLWTLGIFTILIILCCSYAAAQFEVQHRMMFYGFWRTRQQLADFQREQNSQESSGMTALEFLINLMADIGSLLSTVDTKELSPDTFEAVASVRKLHHQCMGIVTGSRDLYSVSWRHMAVPDAISRLYGINEEMWEDDREHDEGDSSPGSGDGIEQRYIRRAKTAGLSGRAVAFGHAESFAQSCLDDEEGPLGGYCVGTGKSYETKASERPLPRRPPAIDVELPRVPFAPLPSQTADLTDLVFGLPRQEPQDDVETKQEKINAGVGNGELDQLLQAVGVVWELDMFAVNNASGDMGFVRVGFHLLAPHIDAIRTSPSVLQRFLLSLQRQYRSCNPYHNHIHGSMVAHLTVCLTRLAGFYCSPPPSCLNNALSMSASSTHGTNSTHHSSTFAREIDEVVFVVASLGHDVGHPGRNNAFLVQSGEPLALLYNDTAVLENYHAYLTFLTLTAHQSNIFANLLASQYRSVRKRIIELILATDISSHFSAISSFRVRRASPEFDIWENDDDRWLAAKLCIKAADVGHAAVEWAEHYQWSLRVVEEFYGQGDEELQYGLVVSPLCDRTKHGELAKSQSGFINFVVIPLLYEVETLGLFGRRGMAVACSMYARDDVKTSRSFNDVSGCASNTGSANLVNAIVTRRALRNAEEWKMREEMEVSAATSTKDYSCNNSNGSSNDGPS